MRIVICWTEVNGYMAACWRALGSKPDANLMVVAGNSGTLDANNAYDTQAIMKGVRAEILSRDELFDKNRIRKIVLSFAPDIVFIPGWFNPAFSALTHDKELSKCRMVMGFDASNTGFLRSAWLGFRYRRLLGRADMVIVPGERSWQFARNNLCIPEHKLRCGLYGGDSEGLVAAWERRSKSPGGWPRRFLFMGRYVQTKGINELADAYRIYRSRVSDPWSLTCCGKGELAPIIQTQAGITDLGFVQPTAQIDVFANHGAFVLPSLYDPWGVVILEALSAGLPVICTNACGSSVELVSHYYNGLLVPTRDAAALSKAFQWMHEHYSILPRLGSQALEAIRPYEAGAWADRWMNFFRELL